MKNLVTLFLIALVVIIFADCAGKPEKAIVGRWELKSQGCDEKGDKCKDADATVIQQFKEDGKCIRHIASFTPSLWTYKVKEKHVTLNLYENDSVIKEFDIIDYGRNEMLIRWQYYTNCELYRRLN
ncbi:MAG: hypothetical protein JXA20_11285 [Spirochaetes bacterium]|nr:hypothetical protein [Spirochaetota bacterium]